MRTKTPINAPEGSATVRIIPHSHVSFRLGHGLSNRISKPVCGAGDDDHFAGETQLVEDVGGGVGEGSREAFSGRGAILLAHGHFALLFVVDV